MVAVATAYNLLGNSVLPQRFYIPAGLAAAATISAIASRNDAGLVEQGLDPATVSPGIAHGLGAALPIAAIIAAGAHHEASRHLYADQQITGASPGRATYEVVARIPLGTALPEELIFRGALLGVFERHHGRVTATFMSSGLFGLWHIAPTIARLSADGRTAPDSLRAEARSIAASVVVTSLAGILLSVLRYQSGSLVAPWLAHSAANASGFAAGWLVRHRLQRAMTFRWLGPPNEER